MKRLPAAGGIGPPGKLWERSAAGLAYARQAGARDGVVVERATQRARRIDLAGDIVNLLGCHHAGAVLLGKSLRFLRHYVSDDQLSTRGMQACAELAGDVATSLHSNAQPLQAVSMEGPLHTDLHPKQHPERRQGRGITTGAHVAREPGNVG